MRKNTVFKTSHKVRSNNKSDRRYKSSRDLSMMSSRERDLVNSNKQKHTIKNRFYKMNKQVPKRQDEKQCI